MHPLQHGSLKTLARGQDQGVIFTFITHPRYLQTSFSHKRALCLDVVGGYPIVFSSMHHKNGAISHGGSKVQGVCPVQDRRDIHESAERLRKGCCPSSDTRSPIGKPHNVDVGRVTCAISADVPI